MRRLKGSAYQVVALIAYEGVTRERLDRVFGIAVNLEWAREHYFADILQQVARIAGSASVMSFAVIDDRGRRIAGSLEPATRQTVATRVFPVCFSIRRSSPSIRPRISSQRSWTVAASAAGDPTFVLASRGAQRSLFVVIAGVALLALSLIATARARAGERRRRDGPRGFRRHGHARAQDAALYHSRGRRNDCAWAGQDG